jgi:alpha-ketoglutarate-dependent taurine dioxygenase
LDEPAIETLCAQLASTLREAGFVVVRFDRAAAVDPPLYTALVCLQPARSGGDSVLVDGRRIYASLRADWPSALDWLQREYHFDCDGQGSGATLRRRIIEETGGSVRVQYLRSYIESGHHRAGEPLAAEALASLDVLDELLAHPRLRHVFKLTAGDMLLLNNHIMLHGRTAFVDDPERDRRRRLLRLWGRPHCSPRAFHD